MIIQKQKLELLKQQVTLKKQEKQMSKTATSLQGNKNQFCKLLTSTTKNNTQYPIIDTKFQNSLIEMKIENIQQKLKQKGIRTYDQLISLSQQQIDSWKDMVVGYRIKLKKFIKLNKQASQPTLNLKNTKTNNQSRQMLFHKKQSMSQINDIIIEERKQKNIEDIIKQRQKQKVFIPIDRKIQIVEQSWNQDSEITDQDQQIIIRSFMNVFQPRKGILKEMSKRDRTFNKNAKKRVRWSKQVQKMQKQCRVKSHKKYPKQTIIKQALMSLENNSYEQGMRNKLKDKQGLRYCWKCFKKSEIKQQVNKKQNKDKYFCSEKCEMLYNKQINNFSLKIQKSVEMDNHEDSNDEEFQQDIEIIDLSIL